MSVKLTTTIKSSASSDGFSSNQGTPKIRTDKYRPFKVSETDTVYEGPPFIDKLSLVGDLTVSMVTKAAKAAQQDPATTLKKLVHHAHKNLKGDVIETFKSAKLDKMQGAKVRLGERDATTVFGISHMPKTKGSTTYQLKIEMNPRRLEASGLGDVEAIFEHLFDDEIEFDRWLAGAKASRVDIAVDLINVRVVDLIFRSTEGHKWSAFFSPTSTLETWSRLSKPNYQSAKSGKSGPPFIVVYDKRQQRVDVGKPTYFAHVPHTRVEYRKRSGNQHFCNLPGLGNHLNAISFGYVPDVASVLGKHGRAYVDAVFRRGVDEALSPLPVTKMKLLREAIEKSEVGFWNPASNWERWSKSLDEVGLSAWISRAQAAKEKYEVSI